MDIKLQRGKPPPLRRQRGRLLSKEGAKTGSGLRRVIGKHREKSKKATLKRKRENDVRKKKTSPVQR